MSSDVNSAYSADVCTCSGAHAAVRCGAYLELFSSREWTRWRVVSAGP